MNNKGILSDVANCQTYEQIINFIKTDLNDRYKAAALAMLKRASESIGVDEYRNSSLDLLDELSKAKSEIDIVSAHQIEIVDLTSRILRAAQKFTWDNTIPCTEWPTPREISEVVKVAAEMEISKANT